jgi:aldehyde:ferredoxin oxidoreductase
MIRSREEVVRVDLTAESVERVSIPDGWLRQFVGGKGVGARLLYDAVDPGTDPLGPGNAFCVLVGPLTGLLPGDDRYAVVTKSPLTGGFLDSYAGGSFAGALAGALPTVMGLWVVGRASDPVRLVVADGSVAIERASTWGADVEAVADAHPDAAVACVGPAGESLVASATVAADGGDHQAGRGGAGAVMGSKRLKAIVARGDPPTGLPALRERDAARFADSATGRWLAAGGTVETVDFADETGILPTRGWQEGTFAGVDAPDGIGIDAVRSVATGRENDPDGPTPGDFRVPTDDGDDGDGETTPRGGATAVLGAGLGIDDGRAVARLARRCDRLGLDLIDGGNAVAWAIRAAGAGHVDRDLSFGDPDAAAALLGEIATRGTPLGDALADGIDAAARRYGGDDLVPTVKSMALPGYDPRGAESMALAYATSDRGACHRRALPAEEEAFASWDVDRTVATVIAEQDRSAARWCLIADDFVGDVLDGLGTEWLAAAGVDVAGDPRTVGERVWTLTRLFNVREGTSRGDDALPDTLRRPLGSGPNEGRAVDPERFERLLDAYYAERGWGPDGRPTRATVERVGLGDVVDDATPLGGDRAN